MAEIKGKIGVTTENIFPVIKQFLYSDHEIFLRELVANAVDATEKIKALASSGDFKGVLGELSVRVELDEDKKVLKVIDRGIGMTEEEIDKYINQIAFSSAGEFLVFKKISSVDCDFFKRQHHRPFRSRILFSVHGFQEGDHRVIVLERGCETGHVVL